MQELEKRIEELQKQNKELKWFAMRYYANEKQKDYLYKEIKNLTQQIKLYSNRFFILTMWFSILSLWFLFILFKIWNQ